MPIFSSFWRAPLALAVLLAGCSAIEPPRPETDPALPPPAPITPPVQSQPLQGQITTAPLPGQPPAPPPAAPMTARQAQQRLVELGYRPGPIDGRLGKASAAALRAFQRDHGLPESGQLDAATRQALAR